MRWWRDISTADKSSRTNVKLKCKSCEYIGRYRYCNDSEPQPSFLAWRNDAGLFSDPTHWMPISEPCEE